MKSIAPISSTLHELRTIAFYLPQFHPVSENDAWWGKGFTEWRNVVNARPLFKGHYQPHLPADLGFYDLRVPETREAQAQLASSHGIGGFCYYHYWFHGRRLLHRPIDDVVRTATPRLPFCLCWANESWNRTWDHQEHEVLIRQEFSVQDDRAHIEHLLTLFSDDRYIKIDGRPLFLVYRASLLPEPVRTSDAWRKACVAAGLPGLYLAKVESSPRERDVAPAQMGFDASVEFAPDWGSLPPRKFHRDRWDNVARAHTALRKLGMLPAAYSTHRIFSYAKLSEQMQAKPPATNVRFRCVTPGWDNSPRRRRDANIFHGSTPALFERWVEAMARDTLIRQHGDERILFVNAWNEWAEGNHLEPDLRWGRAYLDATSRGLRKAIDNAGPA